MIACVGFDDLLARATGEEAVLGLVLTGSQARGMATSSSDHDVYIIVERRGGGWDQTLRSREVDEIVFSLDELADTSVLWNRYSFRGAKILLDRLDGKISHLVEAQATPTAAEADAWAREGLDAYVNQIYRAAKSRRDGRPVLARLDEMESVAWFLTTLFALYGRLRPYNKYLRWELETYPLGSPWSADALPQRLADDPAGLFGDLERVARERGYGEVLDAWGDELELGRRHA